MRAWIVVAEQLFRLRLIGADAERAVVGVLQPGRQVLPIVEADDVVEAERESVPQPALERNLDRVVRAMQVALILRDRAVAANRPHQILRHGGRAGRRARRQRAVLVLRPGTPRRSPPR